MAASLAGQEEEDIPIDSITNGIHVPTWIEPKMEILFNKYLGPDWLKDHDSQAVWDSVDHVPDEELWQVHYWLKMKLVNFIREQARRRWVENRANVTNVLSSGIMLDPAALTIGFARRFTAYKGLICYFATFHD